MTDAETRSQADIDLYGLISIAFSNKLLITLCALVFFGLAAGFAFWLKPVYRAEVLLLPADQEAESDSLSALAGQFGGLASLAGINISGDHAKEKALTTLSSRSFTLDFIRENGLMPVLFANKWDNENQKWKPEDTAEHPTEWDAYKLFDRKVRFVEEEPRSGVIVLAIQWKDGELAARWANQLADKVNTQLRTHAIQEAETSIEYLQQELEKTSVVELQQGIYRLIENHTNKKMLANVRDDYAFEIMDPAVVPDVDDFESPKRMLMMAAGLGAGGFLGLILAILKTQRRRR